MNLSLLDDPVFVELGFTLTVEEEQPVDRVLVMSKENKLRRNRLALLQAISKVLIQIADYSQVVVEGEKPATKK